MFLSAKPTNARIYADAIDLPALVWCININWGYFSHHPLQRERKYTYIHASLHSCTRVPNLRSSAVLRLVRYMPYDKLFLAEMRRVLLLYAK